MQTKGEKIPPVLYVENPQSLVLTLTQLMLEHKVTHSTHAQHAPFNMNL
jgi:hypothetical protein